MSSIRHSDSEYDFMNDVISIEAAADLLGLTGRQVTRLVKSGLIVGKLLGRQWALSKASVMALKAERDKGSTPD